MPCVSDFLCLHLLGDIWVWGGGGTPVHIRKVYGYKRGACCSFGSEKWSRVAKKRYKIQVVATCCKGLYNFYNSLTLMLTICVELPLEQTDVIAKPTLNDSRYPDMFFFLRVLLSAHGVSRYIVHGSALSLPSFTWLTALYYLTELHKWHQNNPRGHVLTCGCLSVLTVIECNAAADLPLMFDHHFGANICRPRL